MEQTSVPLADPGLATVAPTRKRGRPRDPEADGRILSAAAGLVLERGFEAMTVDEVAVRARVGKATVYRRWASKEDLAVAAMAKLYTAEIPLIDTGTLHGDLVLAYTNLLRFVNSPIGENYLRITITESIRDHRVTRLHRVAIEAMETEAAVLFERAVRRGEIRPDAPVPWSMQWVLGLILTAVVTGRELPQPEDAVRLAAMTLYGIGG